LEGLVLSQLLELLAGWCVHVAGRGDGHLQLHICGARPLGHTDDAHVLYTIKRVYTMKTDTKDTIQANEG
jgi:hypothetical protein